MRYPIAIELGDDNNAYGVSFPDVPGCFSAGDSYDEAIDNAKEALAGHLQVAAEYGEPIIKGSTVEQHINNPDYQGCSWAFIELDITPYLGKSKKINVTLPESLISRIDNVSSNRSKFLADAAMAALSAQSKDN